MTEGNMSKIYQPKKYGEYTLPHNVYMMMNFLIRDYDRLKEQYESDIAYKPPVLDGTPGGNAITKPVENVTMALLNKHKELHAIETALEIIPEEYRRPVLLNITARRRYPPHAAISTYSRYKQAFIYKVAKLLDYI